MRFLTVLFFICIPLAAQAQVRDSVFRSYETYETYVDKMIMAREFGPFVQQMGGRDEYTPEQLASTTAQLMRAFPIDFSDVRVFRHEELGGGLFQEGRIYWNGDVYAFFYALLHQREGDLIVLNFTLNSSARAVMERF